MVIEHSFKFLDALRFSLKNDKMFAGRQGLKIGRPVIMFNTIKMVNNPANGHRFTMMPFPNQAVFANLTGGAGSGVRREEYSHIALGIRVTSTHSPFASLRKIQVSASYAPSSLTRNLFPAVAAPGSMMFSPVEDHSAPLTTGRAGVNHSAAIRTRMAIGEAPLPGGLNFSCLSHITIVPHRSKDVQPTVAV